MTADDASNDDVPARWSAAPQSPDMWMDPAQDPRLGADLHGERETLLDYLRAYRMTLEMKCADLDADQLARRSVPPSTMSLLGLVRHMADVERYWFRRVMGQADAPPRYARRVHRRAARGAGAHDRGVRPPLRTR